MNIDWNVNVFFIESMEKCICETLYPTDRQQEKREDILSALWQKPLEPQKNKKESNMTS